MTDTCILAVSFRFPVPAEPHRWYRDTDLAELWNIKPQTVRLMRMLAKRRGVPPHADQIRVRRRNAARWWRETRGDYAAVLEALWNQGAFFRRPRR